MREATGDARSRTTAARSGAPGGVAAIIPAAGAGRRMGGRTPKQFLRLRRSSVLLVTVGHFARHPAIGSIVLVAPAAHAARTVGLVRPLARRCPLIVVPGGQERQDSVRCGLERVPEPVEIVVVHDAVRPFVSAALITAVIDAARRDGAAVCALPVTETLKRVTDGYVTATIDRSTLWTVQTPQAFRAALLRAAHDKAREDGFLGTDEAMLVERLGHPVRVVPGLDENIKITTPGDLRRARRLGRRGW
jgi:2-C-methyl-D-erythritol 4-phosphate cytidylyltransferase